MPVLILLIVILVVAWFKVTENSFKKVRAQLVEAEKKLEDAVFSRRDALAGLRQAMGGMFPESELPAVPELVERIHVREMESVGCCGNDSCMRQRRRGGNASSTRTADSRGADGE